MGIYLDDVLQRTENRDGQNRGIYIQTENTDNDEMREKKPGKMYFLQKLNN